MLYIWIQRPIKQIFIQYLLNVSYLNTIGDRASNKNSCCLHGHDDSARKWKRLNTHTRLTVAQTGKNLPAVQEIWVRSLGWEDPLGEGRATHSSIHAWRIPWTEEPGRLQSMRSQRVRQDWGTKPLLTFTNKAARHISGTSLLLHIFSCLKGGYLKVEQLDQMVVIYSAFWNCKLGIPWQSSG